MKWQDCYKLPLKVDDYCTIITWTADNQRAFDWCYNVRPGKQKELINAINGIEYPKFQYKFYRKGIEICSTNPIIDGPILRIRGWGYLTGTGGLHLSEEEAIKIQDEFGDYIIEQLNKNING